MRRPLNATATKTGSGPDTRRWIITAFNRLVLGRRYGSLSVGEVSRRAGVGRSTFYEHFRGKDDVLRHALRPVLEPLADAATSRGNVAVVRAALEHISSQRVRAGEMLNGPERSLMEAELAELILERLSAASAGDHPDAKSLIAARLAGAQIGLIRAWLNPAGGTCSAEQAARVLINDAAHARP